MLIAITSKYFCAGVIIEAGLVVEAAPILRYMKGWRTQNMVDFCRKRRWKVDELE